MVKGVRMSIPSFLLGMLGVKHLDTIDIFLLLDKAFQWRHSASNATLLWHVINGHGKLFLSVVQYARQASCFSIILSSDKYLAPLISFEHLSRPTTSFYVYAQHRNVLYQPLSFSMHTTQAPPTRPDPCLFPPAKI
jgi:hypothetical protein